MTRVMKNIKSLVSVGIALFLSGGCSIIGYTIGSAVDSRKADNKLISGCYYTQVRPGKIVTLLNHDGSRLRGAFLGVGVAADSNYKKMLDSARARTSLDLPALGEKVFLRLESGAAEEAEFRGFDYQFPNFVLLPAVLLKFPDRDTVIAVGTSALHEICTLDGEILNTDDLEVGIARGIIPTRTTLAIDTGAVRAIRITPEGLRSDTTLYQKLRKTRPRLLGVVTRSDLAVTLENHETYWTVESPEVCFASDQGQLCEKLENLKFIDFEVPGDSTLPGEISLSTVAAIRVAQSRHAAINGFIVGLGLDLTVVILGIAGAGSMDFNMNLGG